MVWAFILSVIILSACAISYPLFWNNLQSYNIPLNQNNDLIQADYLLSALSDLEEDFLFGKITNVEYKEQKVFLQRSYLDLKERMDANDFLTKETKLTK